jgi:thiamine biosynthesis protein ThiI
MIPPMAVAPTSFLVNYHEVALKGRNRPWFVQTLVRNIRAATMGMGVRDVRAYKGRVEVVLAEGAGVPVVISRLAHVFGIANFAPAVRCAPVEAAIAGTVLATLPDADPASFRVVVRRSDKRFPVPSPEMERRLGAAIVQARRWPVRLKHPDLTISVNVVPGAAFCEIGRIAGAGGLPTGVSGRVLCLVSGGIDSPVAAWRMMRRGCRADLVHFHSVPLTSAASREKARAAARRLARYQLGVRLALVPIADAQRHIAVVTAPALRTVVYRRLMLRIAEVLARRWETVALVTGDAVGQVASQTLENLALVEEAASLPVLRPLVGMDKDEVVLSAQRLGTFEASIAPADDPCVLLAPRRAATRASRHAVLRAEQTLDMAALVSSALDAAEVEHVEPDW